MPTISEMQFVPYSTEIALLATPSCPVRSDPMMIPALWFIITWPIFITWLIANVFCFKRSSSARDEKIVPEEEPVLAPAPEPEPAPAPAPEQPRDLTDPISELLLQKNCSARELLMELRGIDPTITKHDVNSCLYSMRAKSLTVSIQHQKKSPVWALVEQKPKKFTKRIPPTFTLEQLAEFYELEGTEHGVNCRGDVGNTDGEYLGHFDFKTRIHNPFAAKPADWETIIASQ